MSFIVPKLSPRGDNIRDNIRRRIRQKSNSGNFWDVSDIKIFIRKIKVKGIGEVVI